ncbi:MAG TPA: SWIM zinc finger family protein [Solirubrobacteraceae bacterium]|nr:SWIM zinc finger family protein [Solirubrobacteraceae bacterium]
MSDFSHWRDWEPSRPLPVEGGITARSKRGAIGETWWSQRFIAVLESFGVGSRLQRGRNYARRGQVIELDVEPGIVIAKVQGSRYTPYRVRIRCKALSEQQWRRLEKAMASQALPLAQLLAGEMPRDVAELFASCKLTLFPRSAAELKASCTCPDSANPCKHIAAAYYILAERFDQDPFQIFAWRGREQDELLEHLRALRVGSSAARAARGTGRRAGSASAVAATSAASPEGSESLGPALIDEIDSFWHSGPALSDLHVNPFAVEATDALLRQLGPAPVDVGGENLVEILTPVYRALAEQAERRALE